MCKNHKKLTVSTNGGLKSFGKKATRKLSPLTVHFNQNYMATILSFKEVVYILGMRITTDTNQERAITVTLQNGRFFRFKECKSGIYYCDTENKDDDSEEKITLITIPLLIILVFRPSTKIQTYQPKKKYLEHPRQGYINTYYAAHPQ